MSETVTEVRVHTCPLFSGTHHGAVRPKHLQRYLDEVVFRFNRRKAKATSHGFARLIEYAVKTPPTTYCGIVHGAAA